MNLILQRGPSGQFGTFGLLYHGQIPLCNTLEDPPNNNQVGISCIPRGLYECLPHNGVKFKNVWMLQNVPGRSAILIHAGNTIDATSGCILVGMGLGRISGQPGIINSQTALNMLRKILPPTFTIEIKGA